MKTSRLKKVLKGLLRINELLDKEEDLISLMKELNTLNISTRPQACSESEVVESWLNIGGKDA